MSCVYVSYELRITDTHEVCLWQLTFYFSLNHHKFRNANYKTKHKILLVPLLSRCQVNVAVLALDCTAKPSNNTTSASTSIIFHLLLSIWKCRVSTNVRKSDYACCKVPRFVLFGERCKFRIVVTSLRLEAGPSIHNAAVLLWYGSENILMTGIPQSAVHIT
jgi:hypothetical protein